MSDLPERVRSSEFERVHHFFEPGMRVLELGGGNGYQARIIASLGCSVISIDVSDRPKPVTQYFEVIDYDGKTLPFGDREFDLIFSSHVLEHVADPHRMLGEIRRVMRQGAFAIHVLPSAAWRLSTIPAHYVYALKYILGKREIPGLPVAPTLTATAHKKGLGHALRRAVFPGPHGEYPNAFAELYYFTRSRWSRVFRQSGFQVQSVTPNEIFLTGYGLIPSLSIRTRRRLAAILGSSSNTFVVSVS
jgi:SAM-dependent methyltransferase